MGDYRVGGALTRREQPPDLEQLTSEYWRQLAKNAPPKGAREPPSDKLKYPK